MRCRQLIAVLLGGFLGCVEELPAPNLGDTPPYCVDGVADSPPLTTGAELTDDFCVQVSRLLCEQWSRCDCWDTAELIDEGATCLGRIETSCLSLVTHPDVADARERDTLVFSRDGLLAFVEALRRATEGCEFVDLDLANIAAGQLVHDTPCSRIAGPFTECVDGLECNPPYFGGDLACRADIFQPGNQEEGERCGHVSFRLAACREGLRCAPTCGAVDNVCSRPLGNGLPCLHPEDCSTGLCMPSVGRWGPEFPGRCGDPGVLGNGEVCSAHAECTSGRCGHDDLPEGICGYDGDACSRTANCDRRPCVFRGLRGRCVAVLGAGEPCDDDTLCRSFECVDGRCEAGREPGWECRVDDECALGACIAGRCGAEDRLANATCDHDADCASHTCIAGRCRERTCWGALVDRDTLTAWEVPQAVFSPYEEDAAADSGR